ncbi:MAG: hypothetical protein ACI4DK_08100 [Lachnospiraceae bacterium]
MWLMNMEDGEIKTFFHTKSEFIKENYLILHGSNKSYIVEADNIQLKLSDGHGYCEKKFPVLYDTVHGPLTNSSICEYGVSVSIFAEGTTEEIEFIANTLRTVRTYKG